MIWDETLYAGAADFYSRGRLPYAPGLPSALATCSRSTAGGACSTWAAVPGRSR